MDREQVFSLLDGAGISCRTVFHPPVYSMADLDALPELAAEKSRIAKNLFLKGREKYLYVARAEGRADLRALGEKLSSPGLHFASERELSETFGVGRGELTPFCTLCPEARGTVVLVDGFFVGGEIGVHPCDNAATVFLSADALFGLLAERGVRVRRL